MAKNNSEIAVAGKAEMVLPEWLKSEVGHQQGMENVEQSDLLLPRLGLCQALSPQRRKSDPKFIPDLKEGQLFNTVTNEIYGETLELYLLFFFKNRIKYFPIDEGGGIECISANGIDGGQLRPDGCAFCDFSKFGNGSKDPQHAGDPPACTNYANFMCLTSEGLEPIALSYKSTGLQVAKQLLAQIRLSRLPMFAKRYQITVGEKRDGQNEWFEKKIAPVGYPDKDTFEGLRKEFESLSKLNIKMTGDEDTDFPTGGGSASGRSEL